MFNNAYQCSRRGTQEGVPNPGDTLTAKNTEAGSSRVRSSPYLSSSIESIQMNGKAQGRLQ